ncbi:torsin-1A-interacting protein 2-like isoform X2 [Cottoperca gobio]|uniref:Torsin-1A-interacting protein 2-like isoform X2 n=1 Tax=Cottoperca gobio TaxID=56716 RepID=A0A6J2PKX2_COTGO|nr:torsin-1A-interacting protein 2-like isoform X2 [Cottoperca gobio]
MAEQDHHPTAERKEEDEKQSTTNHDDSPADNKEERDPDGKRQLPEDSVSSSASTNSGTKNNNGEDMTQPVKTSNLLLSEVPPSKDTDHHLTADGKEEDETQSATDHDVNKAGETDLDEKQKLSEAKSASELDGDPADAVPPDVDTTLNRTPPPGDVGSHGDPAGAGRGPPDVDATLNRTPPQGGQGEYNTGEKKASETTSPPTLGDAKDDQVDGPKEESPDTNNTNTGDDDGSGRKKVLTRKAEKGTRSRASSQTQQDVETIGPTTQEAAHVPEGNLRGSRIFVMAGILLFFAIMGQYLLQVESPLQKKDVRQIDIFLGQFEKVKTRFPNQRAELWSRSKIHLLRHLETAQPTEPVSLILTAGHGAERTLHCLAQSLASAFSTSLNASVLHIDGASKAGQDSDQVKLDIDGKLQGAFEGDKPVAVINRFEELPPGSTLIFYRYCDHENAAYKNKCLIFTVLLGEEEEIPAEARLSSVEEMVDDRLQKKFLSDGRPLAFDRMDLDKYGGLWSRISHLILPVAADKRIEHEGCLWT